MNFHPQSRPRHLIVVLGDQLGLNSSAFDGFDPQIDAVWMAEVRGEASHVWSHKARIVVFLSAMRHFAEDLRARGVTVHYRRMEDSSNLGSLRAELCSAASRLCPQALIAVEPGEWRVKEMLQDAARDVGLNLQICADHHFICPREEFEEHAKRHRQLRMEFFYREMRRKTGVLMEGGEPVGGEWNYDSENRGSFGKEGPGATPEPAAFFPDAITQEVIRMVEEWFPEHPGSLAQFDWPVTAVQAREALHDFVQHRLPWFGQYQDAMWTSRDEADGQLLNVSADPKRSRAFLYHSRISSTLNLKLLDPREVVAAAEQAYREGRVPLASAEGFIRQILGWREYVRGVYWHWMPQYLELNALNATQELPDFYWTGDTDMSCLREVIGQTLEFGYAHHIQRLMITGLFALLYGVKPRAVHEWYLAIYVDAVEWVELPNTLGMSQYADGGIMASKPYIASGKYIQRMSNYCSGCLYNPAKATGGEACPFTTLYWDFLDRHEDRLKANPRMAMQLKNLARLSPNEREAIRKQAQDLRAEPVTK